MVSQVITSTGFALACLAGVAPDVNGDGCVDLMDFAELQNAMIGPNCQEPDIFMEMVSIPGGGAGPDYTFEIGKFEVTNKQFATFLNSAHLDGGASRRGSYMFFHGVGEVQTLNGETMFAPHSLYGESKIGFAPAAPIGLRYQVLSGYEEFPVIGLTWVGAAKFCNWLTIDQGFTDSDLCFVEGASFLEWRPATIQGDAWPVRDLDASERQALISNFTGFRLPMQNIEWGVSGVLPNSFGEWYKAAAYDPLAPDYVRVGALHETIPPSHWGFGYGRDTVSPGDANYAGNFDPFEAGAAPVGYFDGVNWLAGQSARTNFNQNAYGIYDMSGNVLELLLDRLGYQSNGYVGGSWESTPSHLSLAVYKPYAPTSYGNAVGFRVVRIP